MIIARVMAKYLMMLYVLLFKKGTGSLKAWITAFFILMIILLLNTSVLNTELKKKVEKIGAICRIEKPRRGSIFDRDGQALASSRISRDIVVFRRPTETRMYELIADFMDEKIPLTKDEIVKAFQETEYNIKLVEGMSQEEYDKFWEFRYLYFSKELDKFYNENPERFSGFAGKNEFYKKFDRQFGEIQVQKNYNRCYPRGEMFAHIIGFSSEVHGEFTAWKGLELKENKLLKGEEGQVTERKTPHGIKLPGSESNTKGLVPGYDLRLTLSSEIQSLAYKVLEERVTTTKAKGGCIIILDAPSAEILALTSYPSFDPENYKDYIDIGPAHPELLPSDEYRLNPMHNLVTQRSFEPGSVMKPIAAAWALEQGVISPDERFEINPRGIKVKGKDRPITDTHPPDKTEYWKVDDVIIHSSNVGMAQIGMRMGRENLLESLKKFHFGEKVLDFKEEWAGNINKSLVEAINVPSWSKVRQATVAFGQGMTATPIQIVAAMNVFANDGYYVKPRIMLDASSEVYEKCFYPQPEREKVLSKEVLMLMQDSLESVVIEGTGTWAQCKGYRVAGKTGTAEKPDLVSHGYHKNRHYACFVGFGPLPDPKYTILVLLDEPKPHWGGYSCGPAFRVIFENLMVRDGIPPMDEKNAGEEL